MPLHTTELTTTHAPAAANIDKKWFGENGISAADLTTFIENHPHQTIGLFVDSELHGFATFEVLEHRLPTDYVGEISSIPVVMFIQQFTTITNYHLHDSSADAALLAAVEARARELNVSEVWEALDKNHPYSTEKNREFDAFGFYQSRGYTIDPTAALAWQPDAETRIECAMLRKKL